MASSLAEHGSPLDDYFRDEDVSHMAERVQSKPDHGLENETGCDETRVNAPLDTTPSQHKLSLDTSSTSSPNGVGTANSGWTGVVPNTAGPSTPPRTPSPSAHARNTALRPSQPNSEGIHGEIEVQEVQAQEAFAERFKYLVCSSGILERNYVPCLSVGSRERETKSGEELYTRNGASPNAPDDHASPDWLRELASVLRALMEMALAKKDVSLAVCALLLGIAMVVGFWRFVIYSILVAGATGYTYIKYRSTAFTNHRQQIDAPPEPPADTSQEPTHTSLSPSNDALVSLSSFLSASQSLDSNIDTALTQLQPYSSDSSTYHSLRLALHRMTENVVDHFATATSSLLELVDKGELAVLGDMYDISLVSGRSTRRKRGPEEEEQDGGLMEKPDLGGGTSEQADIPPPKGFDGSSPLNFASWSPNSPPGQAALPMSTSHSLPGRARGKHARHLSLANFDPGDNYTSFPVRTPRASKRSSWAPEWSASPARGANEVTPSRPSNHRRITEADEEGETEPESGKGGLEYPQVEDRPYIASADTSQTQALGGNDTSSVESRPIRLRTPDLPATPYTPKRSSPLRRRTSSIELGDYPKRHIMPIVPPTPVRSDRSGSASDFDSRSGPGLLPSPFSSNRESIPITLSMSSPVPNPKRRSLQNLPYYHTPALDPVSPGRPRVGGTDLTRTRSLQHSDLQALRSRSTTPARRSSMVVHPRVDVPFRAHRLSHSSSLSIPFDRQHLLNPDEFGSNTPPVVPASMATPPSSGGKRPRSASVSPLTLPGLKAACLGLHLRRRRLGCCLLALKFASSPEKDGYWVEVQRIVDELRMGIMGEVVALESQLDEMHATPETASRGDIARNPVLPPWMSMPSMPSTGKHSSLEKTDFAPRTPDEAVLLEQIESLSSGLAETWQNLQRVRETLLTDGYAPSRFSAVSQSINVGLAEIGADIEAAWGRIRRDLGGMIRDWERGREAAGNMSASRKAHLASAEGDGAGGHGALSDLPDFMRSWQDPNDEDGMVPSLDLGMSTSGSGSGSGSTRSTSIETDRLLSDPDSADHHEEHGSRPGKNLKDMEVIDFLPPPGIDAVFEADIESVQLGSDKEVLKGMSKVERIELMKVARERGIGLGELIRRNGGFNASGPGAEGEGEEQGRRREEAEAEEAEKRFRFRAQMGGEVVGELKSMIGMIRRRKGVADDGDGDEPSRAVVHGGQDGGTPGREGPMDIAVSNPDSARIRRDEEVMLNGDMQSATPTSEGGGESTGDETISVPLSDPLPLDFREELKRAFVFPRLEQRGQGGEEDEGGEVET